MRCVHTVTSPGGTMRRVYPRRPSGVSQLHNPIKAEQTSCLALFFLLDAAQAECIQHLFAVAGGHSAVAVTHGNDQDMDISFCMIRRTKFSTNAAKSELCTICHTTCAISSHYIQFLYDKSYNLTDNHPSSNNLYDVSHKPKCMQPWTTMRTILHTKSHRFCLCTAT